MSSWFGCGEVGSGPVSQNTMTSASSKLLNPIAMQFTLLEGFEGWSTDKDGILTFPMFKSVPRDPQPLRPDAQGRLKLPKLPNHGSGLKRPKVARRNLTKIVYNIIHWKLLTLIPINLEDHLWTKTISFISSNLKNQTKQISIITMMLRSCEVRPMVDFTVFHSF